MALIVSIAARPSQMTWTTPAGWTQLSVAAEQINGGSSTDPGGMTMKTFWKIVGTAEPNSYSWTFANTIGIAAPYCGSPNPPSYSNCSAGGSAVGGMLVFSGLDTSSSPIDGTPTSRLMDTSTLTHSTTAITTATDGAAVISMISYLSAGSFVYSGTSCGTVEVLDVSTPVTANAVGTTLQMGWFTKATAGATCAPRSTASSSSDSGIGHLMALRPSQRDLSMDMVRDVALSQGGTANYTLTVKNEGSLSEPGPLSIVNTLPTGLTLASATGVGWSCATAGQVVTCSLAGALAGGVTAVPLVLKVNVGAAASGVFTDTATVSGTGGDSNSANDTDTDTYVISPTPLAYYQMDEASNATTFINTGSGASGNATALSTAKATGNPPGTVGAAIAGSTGTCGAVQIPAGTGAIGVNTALDANTIGNSGSIAFWYAGNTAWNSGTARVLFDASADLGGNNADRHFFLVKDGTGKLVFSLKDSSGTVSTATSPAFSYAVNTWHHIAVTWDMATSSLNIYLDGNTTAVATSNTSTNGTLGAVDTLYLGAQRRTGVGGTPAAYLSTAMNDANGYLDEVRIYNRSLAALEVPSVYALTHACAATVDHFELSLPSTASACSPVVARVTACADTSSPCTNGQATNIGKTATLATTAGTLASSSITFDSLGIANGSLDYSAAATGATASVTLSAGQLPAGQASVLHAYQCCPNGASCVAGTNTSSSCTVTFTACSAAASGFDVVDSNYLAKGYDAATDHRLYTKLAGWSETSNSAANTSFMVDVVALRSANTTETNYVGAGGTSKGVKLEIFDDASGTACNSSGAACAACAKTVVSTVNPVTFTAADAGYQDNVTVALGNTNAYSRLIARITDSSGSPTIYGCSTDAFAVRPQALAVTAKTSAGTAMLPSSSGKAGATTVKAGADFTLNADSSTVGYGGTPTQAGASDFLGSATPNLLTGSFGAANSANGLASGSFQYGEVGYVVLGANAVYDATFPVASGDATNATTGVDCVSGSFSNSKNANGMYGCAVGSGATSWGRFIPDHFSIASPTFTAGCSTGSFSYMDQPLVVSATIESRSLGNARTQNYAGTYGSGVVSIQVENANNGSPISSTRLGGLGTPAWTAGQYNFVATQFRRQTSGREDGPYENLDIGLGVTDEPSLAATARPYLIVRNMDETKASPTDCTVDATGLSVAAGVCTATKVVTAAKIRYGRARLLNAYGSEQLDLPMALRAEYWNGSAFVQNTDDNCTGDTAAVATNAISLALTVPSTATASTLSCVWDTGAPGRSAAGCTTAGAASPIDKQFRKGLSMVTGPVSQQKGDFNLWLKKPTSAGSVTVTATVPSWLQYYWSGVAASSPSGLATFGIYKSPLIYRRENY
jgi:MSHA biogenesis protein MshQ